MFRHWAELMQTNYISSRIGPHKPWTLFQDVGFITHRLYFTMWALRPEFSSTS